MTFDLEDPYIEFELDELLHGWYEVEGVRKITELSRQVRTFLNYKTATIRYKFHSNYSLSTNKRDNRFFETKKGFEKSASKFIKLLKSIKGIKGTVEEGIKFLIDQAAIISDKTITARIKEIEDITNQLFVKIQYFSEQELHERPKFLRLVVKFVQEVCVVKKILNVHLFEFYEELEKNYFNLDKELSVLIPDEISEKGDTRKKKLREVSTS